MTVVECLEDPNVLVQAHGIQLAAHLLLQSVDAKVGPKWNINFNIAHLDTWWWRDRLACRLSRALLKRELFVRGTIVLGEVGRTISSNLTTALNPNGQVDVWGERRVLELGFTMCAT